MDIVLGADKDKAKTWLTKWGRSPLPMQLKMEREVIEAYGMALRGEL